MSARTPTPRIGQASEGFAERGDRCPSERPPTPHLNGSGMAIMAAMNANGLKQHWFNDKSDKRGLARRDGSGYMFVTIDHSAGRIR